MSLKIDSSSKLEASATFKLQQISENLQGNRPYICNDISNGLNFSNNSSYKSSGFLRYQLNYGIRLDSGVSDMSRGVSRNRISGTHYLKHLPTVLARQKDVIRNDEDMSTRSAFPEAASVSLPTSTTTLEYLLHRRSSRSSTDERPEEGGRETAKSEAINQSRPRGMLKALSASDASSLTSSATPDPIASQFFHVEPSLFTYRVITRVAKILDFLQRTNPPVKKLGQVFNDADDIFMMEYEDIHEQTNTFKLTFTILKFQKLFQEALTQTYFYVQFPEFKQYSNLVNVIMYDLQSRKFQRRTASPGEHDKTLCREIEDALISRKTRLQSFMAKERVKHNAPSIDFLLPESLRKVGEGKSKTPIYFWVNQLKTTLEEIVAELETEGFKILEAVEDITEETGKVFQTDRHCSDLLIFPSDLGAYFRDTNWVKMGHLVQQDKTSCLAAESVQYLLGTDKDVIHINVGTGLTTAHIASLLRKKSPLSHIWGFGIGSLSKVKRTIQNLEFLGADTKFLIDDFLCVDPEEARLRSVKVILITARCSKSAVTDPIQFLISEGEDLHCLGELFKASQGVNNMASLALEQEKILKHALSFPRVHAIVYATLSCYQDENESVITKALDSINVTSMNKGIPFRVTPPVLPFTFDEIDSGNSGISERYVKFVPSDKSNGCFVAIISRELDDQRNSLRSSIPIPRSKGLLKKAKSSTSPSDPRSMSVTTSDPTGKNLKQSKRDKRKLKDAVSAPDMKVGIRSKLAGHKSAAAFGARLYQVDLVQKMEQLAKQKSRRPEHANNIKSAVSLR